jgi:predicted DNA-binding transcriptional regulator YafY
MEIISILSAKGHTTMRELAWELDVTRRTIMNDIIALSFDYPVYTKPGEGGGVFITKNYKPYTNTLTLTEQKNLCGLYDKAEGKEKEILFRIIHKYGADKLKI